MASVLIDSHVLIWLLYEPERLGNQAQAMLGQAERVLVSSASLWELTIKHQKGRLQYRPDDLVAGVQALGATQLPVRFEDIRALQNVTTAHKDPFDRILLAQAAHERCIFTTADDVILHAESPVTVQDVLK